MINPSAPIFLILQLQNGALELGSVTIAGGKLSNLTISGGAGILNPLLVDRCTVSGSKGHGIRCEPDNGHNCRFDIRDSTIQDSSGYGLYLKSTLRPNSYREPDGDEAFVDLLGACTISGNKLGSIRADGAHGTFARARARCQAGVKLDAAGQATSNGDIVLNWDGK